MQTYAAGNPISLTFQLEDEAGQPILPTSYRWKISDESAATLQDWQVVPVAVPSSLNGQLVLAIPGALNILTPPAIRGGRTVDLELTAPSGVFQMNQAVIVEGSVKLVTGINSVQTYLQAVMLSHDLSTRSLRGWESNTCKEDRERALIEAYGRLCRLNIVFDHSDNQSRVIAPQFGAVRLSDYTADDLTVLDPPLLMGLRKAQLVEASEILRSDEVAMARDEGLISTTVGESSQFFRSSKPIDRLVMPISTEALEHVQRWVRLTVRIGRS